MTPAYRIPLGRFPLVARFTSQETATNTPLTEIVVNSLITTPIDGANVRMGPITIGGIAWDGGYGISTVEGSSDRGRTRGPANLGEGLSRVAFCTFSYTLYHQVSRTQTVMASATHKLGQSGTIEHI